MNTSLYEYNEVAQALTRKWAKLLKGIENERIRMNTAILLENQYQKPAVITEDTTSGATSTATGFAWNNDGTGQGKDIAPFQHYLLPLVRRVYPNLIANELVGVQPMTSPASLVFYLKYRYTGLVNPDAVSGNKVVQDVQAKGATQPYSEYANFSGNTWQIDPYYSLQTVMNENVGVAADWVGLGSANISRTPKASPVIANTVTIPSNFQVVINHSIQGDTVLGGFTVGTTNQALTEIAESTTSTDTFVGRVDSTTGTVYITCVGSGNINSVLASTTISGVTYKTGGINYDYNMEGNRQLPEMELQVESYPVTPKTRKLRTKWTIEAAQDLRAMHNIDAEQELISVLANEVSAEIDREIINDLVINAAIRVDYDYSNPFVVGGLLSNSTAPGFTGTGGTYLPGVGTTTPFVAVPGATNFEDRNKALFYQILEVSNQIYRQSLRGSGNWIVTSPEIAAKLESLLEFKPDAKTDTQFGMGIQYSGTLNGQFKVFKDPLFRPNLILVGYKGTSFMDAGYFYCPYVPLQLTPTVLDTESFNPRKGLITRYGKAMVENGARMYGVIRVFNITAVGASTLPGQNQTGTEGQRNSQSMGQNVAQNLGSVGTGGTLI